MKKFRRYIPFLLICGGILAFSELCEAQNIMDKLQNNDQTSHFAQAIVEADLEQKFNASGPFTLFVPSNKKFASIPKIQQNNEQLILNHAFTGMATERSLKVMANVTCLSGKRLTINAKNNQVLVNSFRIISPNIKANNGVIHIIDGVIK
ncbi:fasciclin domain-containing protein [Fodinibius halophilus]|uniref:Fasciclin domain-containing protein n=1 Tax=Fodinibius halophilus TaxID=1736908 RepID=A0A6M1TAJ7_9BACT|nr:fasciclin domain-containing protein [Fodinibius halophilus]NGP89051.1 fasciclin domain-containing protein [Fodinibius halophilus]